VAVALVGPYGNHLHLAPDKITTPAPHRSIYTGRMLFMTPNQQCQSTEGNKTGSTSSTKFPWESVSKRILKSVAYLPSYDQKSSVFDFETQ